MLLVKLEVGLRHHTFQSLSCDCLNQKMQRETNLSRFFFFYSGTRLKKYHSHFHMTAKLKGKKIDFCLFKTTVTVKKGL